jgi:hypothetical protein
VTCPALTCHANVPPAATPVPSRREASVPDDLDEPAIRPTDATDLCAELYPTRREALAVARRLRAAGWVVVEHTGHSRRPDGSRIVASVYHPHSYESPGDVVTAEPDP